MKHVSSIIGQPLAIEQTAGLFSHSTLGGPLNDPIQPRLAYGPSGTGKSFLLKNLAKDLAAKGVRTVVIKDCDSILLQTGENTQEVIDAMNCSQHEPIALVLDEAQKVFKGSKQKSAMERDLCQFIFPHGEEVQTRITGKICGEEVTANFRNLILILATNEKESMETSASRKVGEAPFARRLSLIETLNYKQEDMETIIPAYFEENGFKIGDTAAGMVLRLHRGSMAALVAVMKRIKERVFKNTVSKEDVIGACRLTEYLPRGLKKGEGRLLEALTYRDIRKPQAQVISGQFGKLLEASICHLQKQFAVNKEGAVIPYPLIEEKGSKLVITDNGKRTLASMKKDGFSWD